MLDQALRYVKGVNMDYYKKIWENERAKESTEIERLRAENARYRAALEFYADDESGTDDCSVARKALKGGE